jgi:Acetoacetate decarboxylase (ADC)
MVIGYAVPRSPLGMAAIDPPPPWHYSCDVLSIEYWADPKAISAVLPEGLTPDPGAHGRTTIMFLDVQFTAENEEYLDPARYQSREACILVDALWERTPVTFCPYTYVDNEAALARGWIQGFPKRLGSVFQTRTFQATSASSAPVGPGGRFGASLSAHGQRLADALVTLHEKVDDPTKVIDRPTVLLRYFPTLVSGKHNKPAVNELTLSIMDNMKVVDLWVGDAALRMPHAEGEELDDLRPVRIGRGFRYGLSFSVTDLKVLRDFR